jgi:general secretion pathway protein F
MLGQVAEVYDREVATAVRRFLAVLEPVLIVGLAIMVIIIVLSIWLGIIGMTELIV